MRSHPRYLEIMDTSGETKSADGVCLDMFVVDAFTSVPFEGNPAGVCLDSTEEVGYDMNM